MSLPWTRRDFVRIAGGVVALGAYARRAFSRRSPADLASNLDDLARSVRGQLLRGNSPGYDASRVWNLAYDRRPLAIVRAVNVDDVQRCVEYAGKHTVPIGNTAKLRAMPTEDAEAGSGLRAQQYRHGCISTPVA